MRPAAFGLHVVDTGLKKQPIQFSYSKIGMT